MPVVLSDILPYLTFVTPPLVGAFIGYLTNRIAIRMLFRPLKKWHVGPVRVPMTPGVIPSKRHDLAINIGEMVGDHLLTSEEISKAFRNDAFQEHLYRLIEAKTGSFLKKDLGPLAALVHPDYRHYFDIARKTLTYQVKETVIKYLNSDTCMAVLHDAIDRWFDGFLAREINNVLGKEKRESIYLLIDKSFTETFNDLDLESRIDSLVSTEISELLSNSRSLSDVLPDSIQHLILDSLRSQSPLLLDKAADILTEPEVQQKIVTAATKAIEEFIETLGPISGMVKNILNNELIQEKVTAYLAENHLEISALIRSPEVEIRVAAALTERGSVMLQTPFNELVQNIQGARLEQIGAEISRMVTGFLRERNIGLVLSRLLRSSIEKSCHHGTTTIDQISSKFLGTHGTDTLRNWIKEEVVTLVRSQGNRQVVEISIDTLATELINKPIGRLDHIIPTGVRAGLFQSLQTMATNMLVTEVPGVVKSINIRKIVTDRIDSFDLFRLEKLLLSIMEEQFKYINLFGGLLGFLIGCANVAVIMGMNL